MTRPKKLPTPGSDQLAEWKRAQAEHNKAKRNRRGKRPGPPIVGVRIPPPPPDAA